MLTRTKVGQETNISNNQKIFAAITAVILFLCLTVVFFNSKLETVAENASQIKIMSIKQFSEVLFSAYTLPFEVASLLLLAALVGSVVLAMKDRQEGSGVDEKDTVFKNNSIDSGGDDSKDENIPR
jgi:NADH-quinone oxidoreductase subunit J